MRWAVWRRFSALGAAAAAAAAPRWVFTVLAPTEREFDPGGADLVWVQGVNRVGELGPRALIQP